MRRFGWIAVFQIFSMLAIAVAAHAQMRVALVIDNSAYQHTPRLSNPRNDAADMAAALKIHGFRVIEGLDLDKPAFDRRVRDFALLLKGADVGVFFYAGHGLQVGGRNYLVPIDAKGEEAATLDLEMVRVDVIHRIMERQTNTNILFLDACRDNPLARNLARSMGTRSSEVGHGLAALESGVGTLISFSTQPGNVALDGVGRNSPLAGALLKHLGAPKDLSAILIDVRNEVMRETKDRQVPWEHSALRGHFRFNLSAAAGPGVASNPSEQARPGEAEHAWAAAKDSTSIAVLEVVATRYNGTVYADLARARIEELKRAQGRNADDDARSKVEAELMKLQQATPPLSPSPGPLDPRAIPEQVLERDRIEGELAHKRFSRSTMVLLNCDVLWHLRNSIFARHGYRFTTPRGQQAFGTGGWNDNPQLSEIEQNNVNEIKAAEAMNQCPG